MKRGTKVIVTGGECFSGTVLAVCLRHAGDRDRPRHQYLNRHRFAQMCRERRALDQRVGPLFDGPYFERPQSLFPGHRGPSIERSGSPEGHQVTMDCVREATRYKPFRACFGPCHPPSQGCKRRNQVSLLHTESRLRYRASLVGILTLTTLFRDVASRKPLQWHCAGMPVEVRQKPDLEEFRKLLWALEVRTRKQ
jgi:hypothetical protein